MTKAAVRAADESAAEAVAEAAATESAASISVAEARILRYLPTPLTFALIADKLGYLPFGGEGPSGASVPQARGSHSRRSGDPGPCARADYTDLGSVPHARGSRTPAGGL